MTKTQTDSLIERICREQKVEVFEKPQFSKNYGECYTDSGQIIMSNKFSSSKIKLAIFLHELAHILTMRRSGSRYLAASIFQEESSVWSLAQELHLKYLEKPFSKSQADFMIKCLKTYSKYHYSFRKKYNKEPNVKE